MFDETRKGVLSWSVLLRLKVGRHLERRLRLRFDRSAAGQPETEILLLYREK